MHFYYQNSLTTAPAKYQKLMFYLNTHPTGNSHLPQISSSSLWALTLWCFLEKQTNTSCFQFYSHLERQKTTVRAHSHTSGCLPGCWKTRVIRGRNEISLLTPSRGAHKSPSRESRSRSLRLRFFAGPRDARRRRQQRERAQYSERRDLWISRNAVSCVCFAYKHIKIFCCCCCATRAAGA